MQHGNDPHARGWCSAMNHVLTVILPALDAHERMLDALREMRDSEREQLDSQFDFGGAA